MGHARAAVLSMGDELTLGQCLNTNSQWISARLLELGIVTVEQATVPDDLLAIVAALGRLSGAADVLITTGGLGPTSDDLARQALAEAMGDWLVVDGEALEHIAAWFAGRGRRMAEINRVQAMRPSRATCLPNGQGTAPGLCGRIGGCDVFCLPGPPREMSVMFEGSVLPVLRPRSGRSVRTAILHTFGIGESELATRLGELMERGRVPLVGTTASGGVVSIRVRYEGDLPEREAVALVEETVAQCRAAAGPYLIGEGRETLASVVVGLLAGPGRHVAVVESCTGGLLGAMLTEVPGSSRVFWGGWIAYSDEVKSREVGVSPGALEHGAVSPETAAEMARGGLARSGADYCLAITGIAGPDGGSAEKPVGTVYVALAAGGGAMDVRRFRFAGERGAVREWSARAALAVLRLHLVGQGSARLLRQVD